MCWSYLSSDSRSLDGSSNFLNRGSGLISRASRGADGDLDSDLASIDLLALERSESLLLLLLVADIDESVTLATTGLAEATTNDASRDDVDASGLEEVGQGSVVEGEREVGDEDDALGGLSVRLLAFDTGSAGRTRRALGLLGGSVGGSVGRSSIGGDSSSLAFSTLGGRSLLVSGLALMNTKSELISTANQRQPKLQCARKPNFFEHLQAS